MSGVILHDNRKPRERELDKARLQLKESIYRYQAAIEQDHLSRLGTLLRKLKQHQKVFEYLYDRNRR